VVRFSPSAQSVELYQTLLKSIIEQQSLSPNLMELIKFMTASLKKLGSKEDLSVAVLNPEMMN